MNGGPWRPLKAHASTKKFFRGEYQGRSALMIRFASGANERNAFSELTSVLGKKGIPIPPVYFVPDNDEPYLITAFAQGKLLSKVADEASCLDAVIDSALKFGTVTKKIFSKDFPLRVMDRARLRFEMDFFLLHFCAEYLDMEPSEELKNALYRLAEEVDALSKLFCHRDYHSENIITGKKGIFIVDYQDALFAPRSYDLASLYVDGYKDFEPWFRDSLPEIAEKKLRVSLIDFRKTALQRAVKALGTFGFQMVHRKKKRYMEAAVRTSAYVAELADGTTIENKKALTFLKGLKKRLT